MFVNFTNKIAMVFYKQESWCFLFVKNLFDKFRICKIRGAQLNGNLYDQLNGNLYDQFNGDLNDQLNGNLFDQLNGD